MDKSEQIRSEKPSPGRWNYADYYGWIKLFNLGEQEKIFDLLRRLCGSDYSSYVVNVTGSDGRLERGPCSKMELLIYLDGYPGAVSLDRHLDEIKENLYSPPFLESIQGIEVKDVSPNRRKNISQFYVEVPGKGLQPFFSPGRFFDARHIFGDVSVMDSALHEIALEFSSERLNGPLDPYLEGKLQSHIHTTLTGEEIDSEVLRTHFDLTGGRVNYFPERAILGFKQGPLKLIQTALATSQIYALINRKGSEPPAMSPANTEDRIKYLNSTGTVDRKSVG
jgi:hypothetical protein